MEIPWNDILEDNFQKDVFDFELEDLAGPADNFNQENKDVCYMFTYSYFIRLNKE